MAAAKKSSKKEYSRKVDPANKRAKLARADASMNGAKGGDKGVGFPISAAINPR